MSEYLLTIRVPFTAVDDPAARLKANQLIKVLDIKKIEDISLKLQRVVENKPPEKVAL